MSTVSRLNALSLSADEKRFLAAIAAVLQKEIQLRAESLEWLSRESGVARSTLFEILGGRSNPRILTLNAIARALGHKDFVQLFRKMPVKIPGRAASSKQVSRPAR